MPASFLAGNDAHQARLLKSNCLSSALLYLSPLKYAFIYQPSQ
jgi:hypothetical protein